MKQDFIYLKHILDAIETIESYVAVGYEEFMDQTYWQDAVIRKLLNQRSVLWIWV